MLISKKITKKEKVIIYIRDSLPFTARLRFIATEVGVGVTAVMSAIKTLQDNKVINVERVMSGRNTRWRLKKYL